MTGGGEAVGLKPSTKERLAIAHISRRVIRSNFIELVSSSRWMMSTFADHISVKSKKRAVSICSPFVTVSGTRNLGITRLTRQLNGLIGKSPDSGHVVVRTRKKDGGEVRLFYVPVVAF